MQDVNAYKIKFKDNDGNIREAEIGGADERHARFVFLRYYLNEAAEIISVTKTE